MSLTVRDLENLQAHYPDYQLELVDGKIIVMSPSGYESDEVAFRVGGKLWNWVEPRHLGRITGSSAGFNLENTRAPDVSFIRAERLPRSPRGYATIPPDLMVEVKSPTDQVNELRDKIDEFLAQGTVVGLLVNPEDHTVEIRRQNQPPTVLGDGDKLTVPDLLPGWEVPVTDLWPPVFE
ncbi:MAG: Uma2 family endonuclease [Acaryochloris sp. RU_4_1]|nr:Uma2 family endonuclease [Acaryochloris sp. RU_4_1]NJR53859.1 Uma2 family endonuclease [Acaryochloris sp. CRU_2_0]